MKKGTLFIIYILLFSYLNAGLVGVSHVVRAQEDFVFRDDFNDDSLDPSRWTTEVVGEGNSVRETNGEVQVTTYGHGGWDSGRALLKSREIDVDNWSSVSFEADWAFLDPYTAEMLVHVVDLDTGNYVGVHYISWEGPKVSYRYENTSQTEYRRIPTSYVHFKVVVYRDHFEFWEGGVLVKSVPTSSMAGARRFQLVLGGWETSPITSHMRFDNVVVSYSGESEGLRIKILSPEEKVYNTTTVDLNVTANREVEEWRYSLNGGENVTFEPNTTIKAENGENLLVVYALAGDERAEARVNFYVNASEKDKTPPGTVRNLTHEVGPDYIHWTWVNPDDEDFSAALVYVDGKFQGKTDEGEWWLTELAPGETHTIGVLTEDSSGNVNTTWVNDTATTEENVTPSITFLPPTPENGSLIGNGSVVVNVTSNENLSKAVLELDGVNETMLGSGREWHYAANVSDGSHAFVVYGAGPLGNVGRSERRVFEVDTLAPRYSSVGQDEGGVPPGGEVHVHSLWSDPHLSSARLETNATEGASWEWVDGTSFNGTWGWANFTISTEGLEPGTYCWRIEGEDSLGHTNATPVGCFRVYRAPKVVSHSPESPVESHVGDRVEFTVTVDQVVNATWFLDDVKVKAEKGVANSSYVNSNARAGEHGVKVVLENANGSASQFWEWYVYPRPALEVYFVAPTPPDGAMLGTRTVVINVSSSQDLDNATLQWNGANESMIGSGRNRWAEKDGLPDGTYTFRVCGFAGGVVNCTEERTVEVDATAPVLLTYGQNADRVPEGRSVELFARWNDAHLGSVTLLTNATMSGGSFVWRAFEVNSSDGRANWTVTTNESFAGKRFCWYTVANDTFGNENRSPTMCFGVFEPLKVLSASPGKAVVNVPYNGTASFSVTLNQGANVTWFVNGTQVFRDVGNVSTYVNSSLVPGRWNVSVTASNANGTADWSWLMVVGNPPHGPPLISFIPPTPENGSLLGTCRITVLVNASENLSWAVLEFDGVNVSMSGSGRLWNYSGSPCSSEGWHGFSVYGANAYGDVGRSEKRLVEVDLSKPSVSWVHAENMTPAGPNTFRVERLANAGFEVNATDSHPLVYSVYLNPQPGVLMKPYRSGNYRSGVPFRFPVRTGEVGTDVYRVAVYDAVFHHTDLYYFVEVVDTTPPGTVENISVSADEKGFTVRWVNPGDDDFQRVELYLDPDEKSKDWNSSRVANLSGWPGEAMSFSMGAGHGVHVLYARTFDRYGNGGEMVRVSFTVPLPEFSLRYVSPTPENGSVIEEGRSVSVRVTSTVPLRSCTLNVNGVEYGMNVSAVACSGLFEAIPGANYSFHVSAVDVYGRTRETPARTLSAPGCFVDGSELELDLPRDVESLQFPVNFTLVSNCLAGSYDYSAKMGDVETGSSFVPDLRVVGKKRLKLPWGTLTVYVLRGNFSLNLWPIRDAVLKGTERGLGLSVLLTATDHCGRKVSDGGELAVCKNMSKPEVKVGLLGSYREGERVVLNATVDNVKVWNISYSVNGGEWTEFNGSADLTDVLRSGENSVVVRAVSSCGVEGLWRGSTFVGPGNGDWVINDTVRCSGRSVTVNGSLLVTGNGSLLPNGCTLNVLGSVDVNGTLSAVESYVRTRGMSGSGDVEFTGSRLENFGGGTFSGRAEFVRSTLVGGFSFLSVSVVYSNVSGLLSARGNLSVLGSTFAGGEGLSYTRPSWNSPGSMRVVNSTFRNNDFGIRFVGSPSDWHWTVENVTVENNRGCGLYLEGLGRSYSTEELRNVVVRNNGKGVCVKNLRLRVWNSLVESNGERNFEIEGVDWVYVRGTNVTGSGYAFHTENVSGIELRDVNVTGDVSGHPRYLLVYVGTGGRSTFEGGVASNFYAYVNGELRLRSYTVDGGGIEVRPAGRLVVEDVDGIPATSPLDGDASVLKDVHVQGLRNASAQSSIVILNSRLEGSNLETLSTNALVRGCRVDGGRLSFGTNLAWNGASTEVRGNVIGENSQWFYSTEEPAENWVYTTSTAGMSVGNAPFSADEYRSGLANGTEVGEFSDLYLKRVFTLDGLPVQAWLSYYAVSGVEVYINGRKVVDELNREAPLSFVQGWGGGRITAHPLMGVVDVAGYLRAGENVVAVHVRSPNRYPYLQLGAFRGTLYTVEGMAGVRDSLVNAPLYGGAARLILANDEVNGNLSLTYYSRVRVSDSKIHGSVRVSGYLDLRKSNVTGNGTGYGVWSDGRFEVVLNGSEVRGFEYGLHLTPLGSTGSVEVLSSKVTGNEVGVWVHDAEVNVSNSYVMHNGKGMMLIAINGTVYNSLLFDNGEGILVWSGSGTDVTLDHDTVTGGNVGVSVTGGSGRLWLTNSLVQNNELGVLVDGNATVRLENNSLANGRGVHITGKAGSVFLNDTDWGGHEPTLVDDYANGTMYTASGEVEENYDFLDERGTTSPGNTVGTGPGWGSSLLGVSLNVYPAEGTTVRGVVSLEGRATSRTPIESVNYTLVQNGTEELLSSVTVGSGDYSGYVTLDTVGRNLTGEGYLKFTARGVDGTSVSVVKKVRFGNADIEIVSYSISHPTAVYVYRRDPKYYGTAIPYDERFANVSVWLRNVGGLDGVAKVELVLPEYIERHTGRVSLLVAVPAGMTGKFNVLVPITVFDPITLTWDPLPDELPSNGRIPVRIEVRDVDGVLRDVRNATIGFDLGPVFTIVNYEAYEFTRQWCHDTGRCHVKVVGENSYTYDGDGDGNLEAAESHHFDLTIRNVGDRDAYLHSIQVRDAIPERDPNLHNKLLKHNAVTLLRGGDATFMADVWAENLTRLVKPGQSRWVYGAWMPWWLDAPPKFVPPVNFSGDYMTTVGVYYNETVAGQPRPGYYLTISVNYAKTPVKALDKGFVPFTETVGPVQVDVIGVNGNKTYLRLTNTNENIYYSYYAEGDYDMNPEGYLWYHVIPPGFEFRAIADHSREPGTVVPHYRVTVGVEYSLLFNELHLAAIGTEGALKAYDIDVPVETIVSAIVKAGLKITNIVENLDFPDNETIEEYSKGSSAPAVNSMLMADNTTLVPLTLDDMARWEVEFGMNATYYYLLEHLSEQPLPVQVDVMGRLIKAIILDDDLQILFVETVLEVVDNDALNEIYQTVRESEETTPEEELSGNLDTLKEGIKERLVEVLKDEIKKRKSFQELDPEKQAKELDKAGKKIAAAVDTFEKMGEWTFYNVYATLTQPNPLSIQVLDPPANYTVEAERLDATILLGGAGGKLDGWGNVSLTFGETDVYRAEYIVPTPLTGVGRIFNGTLDGMTLVLSGTRKGEMVGNVTMLLRPDPRNASAVFALFRDGDFAEAFVGAYFERVDSVDVEIGNGTVAIKARGSLLALPQDEEIHIELNVGVILTNATVVRAGHYRGSIELRPAFGIDPKNVETTVGGNVEVSRGSENGSVLIAVPKNGTPSLPSIEIVPVRLYEGGTLRVETSEPCSVLWRLGNVTGRGNFVPTTGLEPGSHELSVRCAYGNMTSEENFTVEILKRPTVRETADGERVFAEAGRLVRVSTATDLYRLYFIPRADVNGTVAVHQRPGSVEAPKGYGYVTYAIFNVTHPENWSVSNVTLRFRVSKAWMSANNVSPKSVLLLHWEGEWREYRPTYEYEDLRYVYYRVSVPSLSLFAVVEKVGTGTEVPGTGTETQTPESTGKGRSSYYLLALLGGLVLLLYLRRRR